METTGVPVIVVGELEDLSDHGELTLNGNQDRLGG
jgi:hypothetical protein